MPTSARTGDGEAASAVDRELRRRAAHEAFAHRTRRESQFEAAVLEAHHTPSPDTDDAAARGASSGRMSGAGPTRTTAEPALTDRPWHPAPRSLVLALVGGYAVGSPMVQLTWVQAQILYGLALGLGVLAILGGTWRRVALVPLALFLSNWAVLWATHAHWAAWDTTYSRAVQEAYALRACGLNSTAVVRAFVAATAPKEAGNAQRVLGETGKPGGTLTRLGVCWQSRRERPSRKGRS